MQIHQQQKLPALDHKVLNECCKNTLENLRKNKWKGILEKVIHNKKTRNKLRTLTESQMKDLGLTKADIEKEVSKPLWK